MTQPNQQDTEKEKKIDFGLVEIFDRYDLWEDLNADNIMDDLENLLQSQKEKWVKEMIEKINKNCVEMDWGGYVQAIEKDKIIQLLTNQL